MPETFLVLQASRNAPGIASMGGPPRPRETKGAHRSSERAQVHVVGRRVALDLVEGLGNGTKSAAWLLLNVDDQHRPVVLAEGGPVDYERQGWWRIVLWLRARYRDLLRGQVLEDTVAEELHVQGEVARVTGRTVRLADSLPWFLVGEVRSDHGDVVGVRQHDHRALSVEASPRPGPRLLAAPGRARLCCAVTDAPVVPTPTGTAESRGLCGTPRPELRGPVTRGS